MIRKLAAPIFGSILIVGCGSAPATPTTRAQLDPPRSAFARQGEMTTSVNGLDIAHETYEDDGDTLVCHVEALGKAASIRLSRVTRTARFEQNGASEVQEIPQGVILVANFCWQQIVVAAEEYRGASKPTPVRMLAPGQDAPKDATLQVTEDASGARHVTIVVDAVQITADISKGGAVEHLLIPSQNAEARGHAGPPTVAEATPTAPPAVVGDPLVVDEAFAIDRPNAVLRGTLEMPKDVRTKIPVVLIIAGSGPTDRNANSVAGLKTDTYKQLAAALAHKGIATLRYDKRGVGESTFSGDISKMVLGDFTEDARAIALSLQGDARFSSVSVFGHSEGGLIGLELTQSTAVATLMLASTPGRTMAAVLREQLARQLDAPTMKAVDGAVADVRAGKASTGLPKEIAPLFDARLVSFLRSEIDLNPTSLAKTSKAGRIAILQGDMDMQVSVDDDAKKLAFAVPKAQLTIVPGMAHTLKMESAKKLPQPSYFDPTVPLAAPLVDAIVALLVPAP
jgi:pimeloyl-ACP methyl ester carboxylesterase